MSKRIAIYNYKNDIGKTTSALYMAQSLAKTGKRVMLIDADPQCALTKKLGLDTSKENIKKAIKNTFEGAPLPIIAVDAAVISENLWLVPGSSELSRLESTMTAAHRRENSMKIFSNVVGAFHAFFDIMSEKYQLDYIIIDMQSTMNEVTKNLLMISDYISVPLIFDFFIDEIFILMIKEFHDLNQLKKVLAEKYKNSVYAFPDKRTLFAGFLKQDYNFSKRLEGKDVKPLNMFAQNLKNIGMLLDDVRLKDNNYILSYVPNLKKSDLVEYGMEEMARRVISIV